MQRLGLHFAAQLHMVRVHNASITDLFSSTGSERRQSPSKPTVAVKPIVTKSPKKKAANVENREDSGESNNVYYNIGSAAATSPTHLLPSPEQSENCSASAQTSGPRVEENDSSVADECHVYGNDEDNVYAIFKARKPQLDILFFLKGIRLERT